MTALANGSVPAATAVPGGGVPYGDPEGRGYAPPAPPPPSELDGLRARVAEQQRDLAGWESWAARIEAAKSPSKPSSKLVADIRNLPKRHAVGLCIAAATLVTTVGIMRGTPRHSESEIASMAANNAVGVVAPYVSSQIAANDAKATQVVVPDPFAAYGLELTEDAKTAIGYDPTTGGKSLQPARAQYVANQVRSNLATMQLSQMRLTSTGPTDLRVHNNPAEGYPLFKPPASRAPDSMTTTTAATATSAP